MVKSSASFVLPANRSTVEKITSPNFSTLTARLAVSKLLRPRSSNG